MQVMPKRNFTSAICMLMVLVYTKTQEKRSNGSRKQRSRNMLMHSIILVKCTMMEKEFLKMQLKL